MNEISNDFLKLNMIENLMLVGNQKIPSLTNSRLLSKYKDCHVFILYASQTGTSERYAKGISRFLKKVQIASQISDMSIFSTNDFAELAIMTNIYFIFVASTFGNGEPPDNGLSFFTYLKKSPKLSNLKYSIFALGDRTYDHFCKFGKSLNKTLINLGAKPFLKIYKGDANANMDATYMKWRNDIIKILTTFDIPIQKFETSSMHDYKIISADENKEVFMGEVFKLGSNSRQRKPYHAKNPYLAKVLSNKELIVNGERSCRCITLDLTNSALRYQPGDHCAVYAYNNSEIVERLGGILKIDLDLVIDVIPIDSFNSVKPFPLPCSYRTALTYYLDITSPVRLDLLFEISDCEISISDKEIFDKLININDQTFYQDYIINNCRNIVDFLEDLKSIKIDVNILLQYLPRLSCRYYSISSSLEYCKNELHLTCAIVDYMAPTNRKKYGVASNLLKTLDENGNEISTIPISIRKSLNFHLPVKQNIPIIMVGCGTGVAPFRGFIQHRAAIKKSTNDKIGEMILFFGCRNRKYDFLYEEEFKNFMVEGVLTHLFTAFSRDSIEKYYINQEIRNNSCLIWKLLEKGAYIYVCGSSKISSCVKDSIYYAIKNYGNLDDERTINYFRNLKRQNRYCIEVW